MMVLLRFRVACLLVCVAGIAVGCATVPAKSGEKSFSAYAESVFRHQNEVSSRLMMLNDADLLSENDELQEAEDTMIDSCHLLNDYAERESSGEKLGLRFKLKVQSCVEGCDKSIQRVETLLQKLEERQ